jgi:hypothetical protein
MAPCAMSRILLVTAYVQQKTAGGDSSRPMTRKARSLRIYR